MTEKIINYESFRGLINFGNTCFMNSGIQLLMCNRELGKFLIENNFPQINVYSETFYDYYTAKKGAVMGPVMLKNQYKILNQKYKGYTQEDTHEYLVYVLDNLRESIKNKKPEILNSFDLIHGIDLSQITKYKKKNEKSNNIIKENIIVLPVEEDCDTFDDCLKNFLITENEDAKIEYKIKNTPKYLFFTLKRVQFLNGVLYKIGKKIDINENIIINDKIYSLKSFVYQSGGASSGHYVNFSVKNINGNDKWFRFSDTDVSESDNYEDYMNLSYVYLYERLD